MTGSAFTGARAARSPAVRRSAFAVGATICLLGGAVAVAAWPVLAVLALAVTAILALGVRAPAYAFLAAIALFSFEGTVKVLLTSEGVPFSTPEAVGAGALDVALFGSLACLLWRDRGATPRRVWAAAARPERLALVAIGAWLVLSIAQVFVGGHPGRGIAGLRLTQAYVLCALGGLIVFCRARDGRVTRLLLLAVALATTYAALRVAIGPSAGEAAFARSRFTTTAYGESLRAVGSFSGAIGLESFLTPLLGFSVLLGMLVSRVRVAAWTLAALAAVGVIGSYGRTPLVALVLAACFAAAILVSAPGSSLRVRRAAVGAIGAVLAVTGVAIILALSGTSADLRQRAEGLLHPGSDKSLQLRLDNWDAKLGLLDGHLLGLGLGAIGGASQASSTNLATPTASARLATTDNSYLKVLVEQGPLGLALFVFGVVGLVVTVTARLRRLPLTEMSVGVPALTGFVAFLIVCVTTDDLEQPGKVLAWTLLGAAVGVAIGAREGERRQDQG